MENLIYADGVLAETTNGTHQQVNLQLTSGNLHTPQISVADLHASNITSNLNVDSLHAQQINVSAFTSTPQHLNLSAETLNTPNTVDEAVKQLQLEQEISDSDQVNFATQQQHLQITDESLATTQQVNQLQIVAENGSIQAPQTIQISGEALHTIDTVKIEGVATSTGETVTVDGQQYITLHLGDQNAQVIQALTSGKAVHQMHIEQAQQQQPQQLAAPPDQPPAPDPQPLDHDLYDDDAPRVKHVQHTYDRIKLADASARRLNIEKSKRVLDDNIHTESEKASHDNTSAEQHQLYEETHIKTESEQEQTTQPTDEAAEMDNNETSEKEAEFQAEIQKLGSAPTQFMMGPPSGSEDEEEMNPSSLIKGIVSDINITNEEDIEDEYEDDEDKDPTYQFNDLLVKGDEESEEEEETFPDEEDTSTKNELVLRKTNNNKQVVVSKRKRTYIPTSSSSASKRVKTKMHTEDPELLKQIHDKYNSLCIFCHSSHEESCLIWDPMEKYQDIDQVGPPYTYGMPDQFLMGLSRVYQGAYSLYARDDIPAFTQFGPLKGRIVDETEFRKISLFEIDLENFWPIEASENDELMIENWLDTSDVEISNWLKFLQPESSEPDAPHYNVQRITKNGEIYFVTTEHILSGEELFMRAMEPPYRVYHNLKEVNRTAFACGLFHNIKDAGSQTLVFENMIHYVRHHLFVHTIHPGVFSSAYIYNCAVCGDDCYSKSHRIEHMTVVHHDEENIKSILKRDRRCYYCKKSFSTQAMLGHHIKYNHPREEEILSGFECPICKAKVKTKSTLRKHMQDSHRPVSVTCDICGKVLKNRGTLKVHRMKIHDKKGLKQCAICDKHFSDIYQLRVHSLSHTKLRPFECQVIDCQHASTTKQCLQKHYRQKHGFVDANMPVITRTIELQDIPTFGV